MINATQKMAIHALEIAKIAAEQEDCGESVKKIAKAIGHVKFRRYAEACKIMSAEADYLDGNEDFADAYMLFSRAMNRIPRSQW